MFKIISLSQADKINSDNSKDKVITGWIDEKKEYKEFVLSKNNAVKFSNIFMKSDYKNKETFMAAIGKFNPYTTFLIKEIIVDKLNFEELLSTLKIIEET